MMLLLTSRTEVEGEDLGIGVRAVLEKIERETTEKGVAFVKRILAENREVVIRDFGWT